MTFLLSASMLLVACGNEEATRKEASDQEVGSHSESTNPEVDTQEGGTISLSRALETHPVWFRVNDYPERSTEINSIHYYNDGEVTVYRLLDGTGLIPSEFGESVTLEEILEYSDEELIEIFEESYQDFVEAGIAETFEEQVQVLREEEEYAAVAEAFLNYFYEQFESDKYYESLDNSTDYIIDTTLDGTGNRVESQRIIYDIPSLFSTNEERNFSLDLMKDIVYPYTSLYGYGQSDISVEGIVEFYGTESLQEYANRLTQPVSDVTTTLRFSSGENFEIFDTLFSGYMIDQEFRYYVTRIENESTEFILDDTDVSHPNVTIEGEPSQ